MGTTELVGSGGQLADEAVLAGLRRELALTAGHHTLKMWAGLAPVRPGLQYPKPTRSALELRARPKACGSRRLQALSASAAMNLGASDI